jgi:acetamidase/formamidase
MSVGLVMSSSYRVPAPDSIGGGLAGGTPGRAGAERAPAPSRGLWRVGTGAASFEREVYAMKDHPGHAGHDASRCSLSGCGETDSVERVADEVSDAFAPPARRKRLFRLDEVDGDTLDAVLTARARERRSFLKAGGLLAGCAAVEPLFAAACASPRAEGSKEAAAGSGAAGGPPPPLFPPGGGRVHTIESSNTTVRLGVFDTTLPNLVEVESGDTIVYPRTWSHFLDRLQPGVSIDDLARWRVENPGKGPHSIIGPVAVRGAMPGDVIEVQYHRIRPKGWAANFNNPGSLKTGALPEVFAEGQVKYFTLDLARMTTSFAPDIELPLLPFQGTLGLAPPDGFFGVTNGIYSSVPPGPHAGNVDLREMGEGSRMFIPVWQPGGRIYTGDSHAAQGDGEVNLTALETAMEELRIRVVLHKNVGWRWPIAETATHWIPLGMDKDLNNAFRISLENAIEFLVKRAGLTPLDAYSLCSLGVSFRVTQVVDVNKGVHAMIPKSLFGERLRSRITIV